MKETRSSSSAAALEQFAESGFMWKGFNPSKYNCSHLRKYFSAVQYKHANNMLEIKHCCEV
jgi:hypothetical protein